MLMKIGRNGALALASLLVAATAIYAAGWIRYSDSGPSARLGIQYEYMGRAGELLMTHATPRARPLRPACDPGTACSRSTAHR
ncbi:MAG: hypothetical protein WEB50_12085 [Vicinamibacterales bacterium]